MIDSNSDSVTIVAALVSNFLAINLWNSKSVGDIKGISCVVRLLNIFFTLDGVRLDTGTPSSESIVDPITIFAVRLSVTVVLSNLLFFEARNP